jgi:radical SAM superfamily enzyme YgiQ (UPF0313 family)
MTPTILLSSVFKPFAVHDIYSRKESIHELWHNQLTKAQGIFSPRHSYDSFGLHCIANNLGVPCTVLDFPSQRRFIHEIRKGYDYIGISAITPNFQKVKWMTAKIREVAPKSKIILGGFCTAVPSLDKLLDADYICIGEGISFMRQLLGLPPEFEFKNPDMTFNLRELLGVPAFGLLKNPQIVAGLGCSYRCDFCSPSHFFGHRHIKFFKSGKALFEEIERVSRKYGKNTISIGGDDNFLLDLERADELRRCMIESGRTFKILIFGSADKVAEFGAEKLAEMGVDGIWIGRESDFATYPKNKGIDMKGLIDDLRRHGIKTVLSSILLLDEHTRENIWQDIESHLACRPTFSQFAHYAPIPNTPLWQRMSREGRLIPGIPWEEMHAFSEPWYFHPQFTVKEGKEIQEEAYRRDFHELGPSLLRMIETDFEGWNYLRHANQSHLRARADLLAHQMWGYKIILLAMEVLVPTEKMRELVINVRRKVEKAFGPPTAFQKTAASGVFLFGRFREFRTRHWGDVLQPPTKVVHYKGKESW